MGMVPDMAMKTSFRIGGKSVDVTESVIDRVVGFFDPVRGQRRFQARCQMAVMGGYAGGSRSRRATKGWKTTSNNADADLLPDLPLLRERSRDLVRNTPVGASAVNTTTTNVVGGGIKLNAQIDREYLNLTDKQADDWEAAAEREFNLWACNPVFCDAAATLNFYEHQDLALRSTLENGDIFYTLPNIDRIGQPYKLKIMDIEADRVCNKDHAADTNKLAGGIELDDNGAPVKVHIARTHPGALRKRASEWDVVDVFGAKSGRKNLIHLFEKRRPGQRRGAPYLAPVIESLKQLGRYTDAELMAAVVSGMFTVFIESDSEDPLTNEDGTAVTSADDNELELGNGKVMALAPGEKITSANPGRPNAAFDPFVVAILRQVGAALEIPFELLIKHFTASYSASRAALLEAWKMFRKRRTWLANNFCSPVYEALITEAVINGRLYAPGFLEDVRIRHAYLGAEWIGPGRGQIQEKQEVEAAALRVKEGFSTIARESAEMNGGDFDRIHNKRVKENDKRKEAGLLEGQTSTSADVIVTDPEE